MIAIPTRRSGPPFDDGIPFRSGGPKHMILAAAILLPALPAGAQQAGEIHGFLRFPDTNGRDVAFTSEGDIGIAPPSGGIAHRLTATGPRGALRGCPQQRGRLCPLDGSRAALPQAVVPCKRPLPLDRAIAVVLEKMVKEPMKIPEPPTIPVEAPPARRN
jgi:hypothetical protein